MLRGLTQVPVSSPRWAASLAVFQTVNPNPIFRGEVCPVRKSRRGMLGRLADAFPIEAGRIDFGI